MLDDAMTDNRVTFCVDLNQAELAVRFIEAGEDESGGKRPFGLTAAQCLACLDDTELRDISLALALVAINYFGEQLTAAVEASGGKGRLVKADQQAH
jgi:hypothetical protein